MTTHDGRPSRRALLALLAAAGGGATLLVVGLDRFRSRERPERLVPSGGERAARRLGEYLDRQFGLRDDEVIWRRLESRLGGELGPEGLESEAFRNRVQTAVAAEFDRGEWMVVQGWRLAPTEVDLLVMASRQPADDSSAE